MLPRRAPVDAQRRAAYADDTGYAADAEGRRAPANAGYVTDAPPPGAGMGARLSNRLALVNLRDCRDYGDEGFHDLDPEDPRWPTSIRAGSGLTQMQTFAEPRMINGQADPRSQVLAESANRRMHSGVSSERFAPHSELPESGFVAAAAVARAVAIAASDLRAEPADHRTSSPESDAGAAVAAARAAAASIAAASAPSGVGAGLRAAPAGAAAELSRQHAAELTRPAGGRHLPINAAAPSVTTSLVDAMCLDAGTLAQQGAVLKPTSLRMQDSNGSQKREVEKSFQPGMQVRVDQQFTDVDPDNGILVAPTPDRKLWLVRLANSAGKMIPVASIHAVHRSTRSVGTFLPDVAEPERLTAGVRVMLKNLSSRPEFNGKVGTLQTWDFKEERWRVRLDDGNHSIEEPCKLIKSQNLDVPECTTDLRVGRTIGIRSSSSKPDTFGTIEAWDVERCLWLIQTRDGVAAACDPRHLKVVTDANDKILSQKVSDASWTSEHAVEEHAEPIRAGMRVRVLTAEGEEMPSDPVGIVHRWCGNRTWTVQMCDSKGAAVTEDVHVSRLEPLGKPLEKGTVVRLFGLQSCPWHNGQIGKVAHFDQDAVCWNVDLDRGEKRALRPINVIALTGDRNLIPGAKVRVRQTCAELAGKVGCLVSWDQKIDSWLLDFEHGSQTSARSKDIVAIGDDESRCAALQGAETQSDDNRSAAAASIRESMPARASNSRVHPGARVRVKGLKALMELNGEEGVAVAWEPQEQRWQVRVNNVGYEIRPENLELVSDNQGSNITVGSRVRPFGLISQPHLNGKFGAAIGFDEMSCRWQVLMDDSTRCLFDASKLEVVRGGSNADTFVAAAAAASASAPPSGKIRIGSVVKLNGLKSSPELNGDVGYAIKWDGSDSRWDIWMMNGRRVKIKEHNLELKLSLSPSQPSPSAICPELARFDEP